MRTKSIELRDFMQNKSWTRFKGTYQVKVSGEKIKIKNQSFSLKSFSNSDTTAREEIAPELRVCISIYYDLKMWPLGSSLASVWACSTGYS